MRTVVTGGAGFMGLNVARQLALCGHDVMVLDRRAIREEGMEGRVCDLADKEDLNRAMENAQWVFHFAGTIWCDEPSELALLHAVTTAALEQGVDKVVYASSCSVYGKNAMFEAVREQTPLDPQSPYARAKAQGEALLQRLFDDQGLQSLTLRYFNPFGQGQDARMAVPSFIAHAIKGDPIELFGGGEQVRDFVFIEDIAKATVLAAENCHGCEALNIASGIPRTVREVAEMVLELVGSRSEIVSRDIPKQRLELEVRSRFGSTEKAQRLSGYVPETSLEEGLNRTLVGIRGESAHP